jgi:hypothetical protein
MHGRKKHSYKVSVGKPERRRPRGRHMPIWEDNIRIDLMETAKKYID